jgi:aryl-alcohol dehydrogenase-like predicted oxidoreductase
MRYRKLGKTGVDVSEIGFGAWGIGGAWWAGANNDESLASMCAAFELGVNFVDTAPNYGDGLSEELVGKAIASWPSRIYVSTKVNPMNFKWPAAPGTPISEVFPKEWIVGSAEKSLKRLGIECLDLLLLHVWLDEWAALDEWKEAFAQLKQQGKVAAFGLSLNYPLEPDYGAEAIATGLIDACEVTYNIWEQGPEDALFPLALEKQVAIIVKSPLDEGALTGKITPDTAFEPGSFQDFYFSGNRRQEVAERAERLKFLLRDDGDTLAQAALRFCLSHPAVTTVVTGMRKPHHARENIAASDRGPLPADDLAALKAHAWPHNFWA